MASLILVDERESLPDASQIDVTGSDEPVVEPNEGMSTARLERMLDDIRSQPPFRRTMDKEADYYDNNQLTAEQIQELEERGFAPTITNLIKPTIDVVLGMEAKSRSDWMVRAEDGELSDDMAQALSARLHKAEVESRADRACSDAYADAVKVGLGWVEVSRSADPFASPYRVRRVHRREIFWDWRSSEPDLSDARYLVRKRWLDEDVAIATWPQHRTLIEQTMAGWSAMDYVTSMNESHVLELNRAMDVERGFSVEQYEWLNTQRKQIMCFEVWYRVIARGHVLRLPNGRTVEFDMNNPDHVAAVYNGMLQPIPAMLKRVRVSFWLGPHRVSDDPSPYRHQNFPYIPMFGFREDRTGTPYGMIRGMMSPQDEVNARRSKMLWLLNSRRVTADDDAVEDHNHAAEEIGRPDAYIRLSRQRRPDSVFKVEDGAQLSNQQFQVMEAAKQEINQASGVYQSMLGATGGANSGLAINSLIEQGSTTLAEINDNYRYSRRLVGEMLLEMVREDLAKEINAVVIVGGEGGDPQRQVVLNQPSQDELGRQMLINDVSKARVSVVLDDVNTSPTFRQQQMVQLTELVKSAPPNVQPLIFDLVIEAMDLPRKKQVLERVRKATGVGPNGEAADPQAIAMQQQLEQMQAALQATQQEAGKAVTELEEQVQTLQVQLKDRAQELALKAREVAIKEADVALKANGAVVDQGFRAEEAAAQREIQASAQAAAANSTAGGLDEQKVQQLVQQSMAPILEQIAQLIGGGQPQPGMPAPGGTPPPAQQPVA